MPDAGRPSALKTVPWTAGKAVGDGSEFANAWVSWALAEKVSRSRLNNVAREAGRYMRAALSFHSRGGSPWFLLVSDSEAVTLDAAVSPRYVV
jgi:uncharacterized phage-associated protein